MKMKMSQVLSYGFEYFCAPNFQLETSIPSQTRRVGDEVIYIISTLSIYLSQMWIDVWKWISNPCAHGVRSLGRNALCTFPCQETFWKFIDVKESLHAHFIVKSQTLIKNDILAISLKEARFTMNSLFT